jgi:MFS family permease
MKIFRLLLPIDRFRPNDRAVAAVMWTVGLVQGFGQAHPAATLPFTRAALGLTEADMSLVLAVARFASFGAIAFSVLGDRKGRRGPILAAFTLLVGATGATALVGTPLQFGITQSLVRIATSALTALGVVWLAEQLTPAIRAYGLSIYGAAGSLGAGLAILGLPLAERDWRLPYAVTLVGALLLPLLARRLRESPLIEAGPPVVRTRLQEMVSAVGGGRFWAAAGAGLLASAFSAVGLAFSTERLVGSLGLPTSRAVLITLAGGTAGGLGFFIGGRMADSWGRRPTSVLALIMILGGGVTLYHVQHQPLLLAAIVVSSFGSFAYVPAAASHRAELFPTRIRATMNSSMAWLGTLGSSAGLLAARFTIESWGLPGTMNVLGVGVVLAALLTLVLPETRGRHLEP